MSVTTAQDIINSALRGLQVLSPDVTLTADEANGGLDALNLLLESLSIDSLMVHHITKEPFTLVPGQQSYTIGTGGNFNTDRPIAIESATVTVNGSDYPIETVFAYDDWAAIRLKTLQTTFTQYLYFDGTYPLGTINLYPVPSSATTLTLYSRKELTQFTSLTAPISLPPGYKRMLKYGLQIELAPEYQTTAGDDVKRLYIDAKAGIKRVNKRPITSQVDVALLGNGRGRRFNIYSGR